MHKFRNPRTFDTSLPVTAARLREALEFDGRPIVVRLAQAVGRVPIPRTLFGCQMSALPPELGTRPVGWPHGRRPQNRHSPCRRQRQPLAFAKYTLAMRQMDASSGLTCGMPISDYAASAVHWDQERAGRMFTLIRDDRTGEIDESLCQPSGLPPNDARE